MCWMCIKLCRLERVPKVKNTGLFSVLLITLKEYWTEWIRVWWRENSMFSQLLYYCIVIVNNISIWVDYAIVLSIDSLSVHCVHQRKGSRSLFMCCLIIIFITEAPIFKYQGVTSQIVWECRKTNDWILHMAVCLWNNYPTRRAILNLGSKRSLNHILFLPHHKRKTATSNWLKHLLCFPFHHI